MKKITRFSLACGVSAMALCVSGIATAQDIHFSQFYHSPLTLNPALTGAFGGSYRVGANYKQQWKSVMVDGANQGGPSYPYQTMAASFDQGLYKHSWDNGFMGVGVSFFNDKAGTSQMGTTQVNVSLSADKTINSDNNVAVGLQGGWAQRSIDYSKLTWDNNYQNGTFNPALYPSQEPLATAATSFSYTDFSAGALWNYGYGEKYLSSNDAFKANFGVAMFHVNQPSKYSFYGDAGQKLNAKYIVHGSATIGVPNSATSFVPNFMYVRQGGAQEINLGSYVKYTLQGGSRYTGAKTETAIYFGGWYRFADAFVASVKMDYANFSFAYSYDVNTSSLRTASGTKGGSEFALMYIAPFKQSRSGSYRNVRFL